MFTSLKKHFDHQTLNALWKAYVLQKLGYITNSKIITRHLKLENGDIVTVGTAESPSTVVGSIIGTLIGIIDGEQDKVCFILRNGEDIVRFYLDRGGRPASRLLILLCSRIENIRDFSVEITSLKQDTPGQSRLQLAFTDGGETGIAPYILPRDHARWNRIRIARILAALGIATEEVSTGETDPSVEAVQPAEAMVIEGIRPADSAVSASDTRSVRLVAGFAVLAVVFSEPDPDRPLFLDSATTEETVRLILDSRPESNPRVTLRIFPTMRLKQTFEQGMKAALDGTHNRNMLLINDRTVIDAVLRMADERGIECNR